MQEQFVRAVSCYEVIRRLDNVESLIVMGEVFPDDEELKAIRDYFTRERQGETDFISLQKIDKLRFSARRLWKWLLDNESLYYSNSH